MKNRFLLWSICVTTLLASVGCWSSSPSEVVVYASLDREFSEPIFQDFEKKTGIKVLAKYDVESTKTVGLVNAIIQEKNRPRCDVFWNNEIMHTIRLHKLGLLDTERISAIDAYPKSFVSQDGNWVGFAARARVLIVNTDLVPKEQWPKSIEQLTNPEWKGKCGLAKPLFGTTATQAAVLFSHWGKERAEKFFREVKQNAQVLSGNKQVATSVARGQLAFGLTDTDDAIIEKDNGFPVEIVFPDQAEEELGTLLIPNTIMAIKGAKNTTNAQRLIDFVLSGDVERALAKCESAQIPLRDDIKEPPRVLPAETKMHWMEADYSQAAPQWETAAKFLRDLFETAQ